MRPCAALLLAASAAGAVPPDARLLLSGPKPRIEKIGPGFIAAEVEPAGVLSAQVLKTDELLLEPKGTGVARVFLFAAHVVRVLEVAIDAPLPQAPPVPASCLRDGEARVDSAACYEAWRKRLAHADKAPAISFEGDGWMAAARAAQRALDEAGLKHVQAALTGYGVRLRGARDEPERLKALRALWPAVLGPLRLAE